MRHVFLGVHIFESHAQMKARKVKKDSFAQSVTASVRSHLPIPAFLHCMIVKDVPNMFHNDSQTVAVPIISSHLWDYILANVASIRHRTRFRAGKST